MHSEGSRKPRVCNRAVEREKSSSQANTPEYDGAGDRMDSLSQRDQAGNARDYQREQAHRYHRNEDDDYFLRAGILGCGGGFHDLLSLLCTWDGALQSKHGKAAECLSSPPISCDKVFSAKRCRGGSNGSTTSLDTIGERTGFRALRTAL